MGRTKKAKSELKNKRFITPNELAHLSGKKLTQVMRWNQLNEFLILRDLCVVDPRGNHYQNEKRELIDQFEPEVMEYINQNS